MIEDRPTGRKTFGLDFERMVLEAWEIFLDRPLTLLGIAFLVVLTGFIANLFVLPVFFWAPFTLCIPYAVVQIRARDGSDRIFLGWISVYPRLLAVFVPLMLAMALISGFPGTAWFLLSEASERFYFTYLTVLGSTVCEVTGVYLLGLGGLLAVRRDFSAGEALRGLFSEWRTTLDVLLLSGTLALFALSGMFVCCVGVVATSTFSWICMGIAYFQLFEE